MWQVSKLLAASVVISASVGTAEAASLPTRVGQCTETRIAELGSRLTGVPESGSAVRYQNGGVQISYDVLPGVEGSRVGDRVQLCLVSVPRDCPPGDDRGKVYRGKNLRTGRTWEAPDSSHSCGGA